MSVCKCGSKKRPGDKFCERCEAAELERMQRDRYLTPVPAPTRPRSGSARENKIDTRGGALE